MTRVDIIRIASQNNQDFSKIEAFRKQITKRSRFVCVVCNCSLCRSSIINFENKNYEVDFSVYFYVESFDADHYICKTCSWKRKQFPVTLCSIDLLLPKKLSKILQLERILISSRILFRKVNIKWKETSPKMKRCACNVPILIDKVDINRN